MLHMGLQSWRKPCQTLSCLSSSQHQPESKWTLRPRMTLWLAKKSGLWNPGPFHSTECQEPPASVASVPFASSVNFFSIQDKKPFNKQAGGWGIGSTIKVIATKAGGPELDSPETHANARGAWLPAHLGSLEGWRQDFLSWLVMLLMDCGFDWETHQLQAFIHMCTCTQTRVPTHMYTHSHTVHTHTYTHMENRKRTKMSRLMDIN